MEYYLRKQRGSGLSRLTGITDKSGHASMSIKADSSSGLLQRVRVEPPNLHGSINYWSEIEYNIVRIMIRSRRGRHLESIFVIDDKSRETMTNLKIPQASHPSSTKSYRHRLA